MSNQDAVTEKIEARKKNRKNEPYPSFSQNPKGWMKKFFKEWVLTLGIAFLVAFFFRTTIASPRHIPTGSMIPTIKIGEFIFVSMFAYDWHIPFTRKSLSKRSEPERGDIVVFEYPLDASKDYIKRVIGVPGDSIEVRNKRVILNGRPLELEAVDGKNILEDLDKKYPLDSLQLYKETNGDKTYYVMLMDEAYRPSRDFGPVSVPADSYFVMGDNRDDSQDSRYWGFMPRKNLLGKGSFTWFSFDKDHFPFIRFDRLFHFLN